jgi:hypothetical protein
VTKALVLAALLAACHHPSKCERFADWEAKCGESAQSERETTRTIARGACEAATSGDPAVAKAGAAFARQAECVDQVTPAEKPTPADCDAWKQCRDAVK